MKSLNSEVETDSTFIECIPRPSAIITSPTRSLQVRTRQDGHDYDYDHQNHVMCCQAMLVQVLRTTEAKIPRKVPDIAGRGEGRGRDKGTAEGQSGDGIGEGMGMCGVWFVDD